MTLFPVIFFFVLGVFPSSLLSLFFPSDVSAARVCNAVTPPTLTITNRILRLLALKHRPTETSEAFKRHDAPASYGRAIRDRYEVAGKYDKSLGRAEDSDL